VQSVTQVLLVAHAQRRMVYMLCKNTANHTSSDKSSSNGNWVVLEAVNSTHTAAGIR
jgi:hypothetical protein